MTKISLILTVIFTLLMACARKENAPTESPDEIGRRKGRMMPPFTEATRIDHNRPTMLQLPVRPSTVPEPASIPKPPVQPPTVPAPAVVPKRPTPNRTGFTHSKSVPECTIDNVKQELLTAIIKADEHLKGSLIDGLTELDLEQVIANAVQRAKNCAYPGGEETALNRRLNLINMAKGMLRRPLDEPTLIKVESKLFEAILRLEKEGVDMRSVWGSEELAGYVPPFSL